MTARIATSGIPRDVAARREHSGLGRICPVKIAKRDDRRAVGIEDIKARVEVPPIAHALHFSNSVLHWLCLRLVALGQVPPDRTELISADFIGAARHRLCIISPARLDALTSSTKGRAGPAGSCKGSSTKREYRPGAVSSGGLMKIGTPNGTRLSLRQYVGRSVRAPELCIYDHEGCAAWREGPCCVEVASRLRRTAKPKTVRLARPSQGSSPTLITHQRASYAVEPGRRASPRTSHLT
jgi:hypothetical protein